jgi:hypothetical protein
LNSKCPRPTGPIYAVGPYTLEKEKNGMGFDNLETMILRGLEMKYHGACFEIVIWAQERFQG